MLDFIKQVDLYRQMPKDFTKATASGGTFSLICMIAMVVLFYSELTAFLTTETISRVHVESPIDTGNTHAMLTINMNITVPAIPCALLSVDAQDVMGSHVIDVGGELIKNRVDPVTLALKRDEEGNLLSLDNYREQKGEGCNVHGHLIVQRVPGNFHVSAHAHANLLGALLGAKQPLNVSHVIHELSFGDLEHARELSNVDETVTNPLEGATKIAQFGRAEDAPSYEYYIKTVPTNYLKIGGNLFESYQFSANSNENHGRYRIAAIYFRYEIGAVTVTYEERQMSFAHFVVQVCAIIGGVFTVVGLVNSVFILTLKQFKKNLGKLG